MSIIILGTMYIDNQKDFEDFLELSSKSEAVAIDTEFIRDKTYWPKLCLVQMAIPDKHVVVDALKVNIKPISNLLKNELVVKIFHAPRQDIEILLHETGYIPKPLFDSQTAASFLGYPAQIGYANLVYKELGIKLDKADSYSDWSTRPLSKSQLKYAADDVIYLLKLYYKMCKKLKDLNRLNWAAEDTSAKYLYKQIYEIAPEDRFLHLKRLGSLSKKQLGAAKEVASWRENYAIKHNIPRKWVIKDDEIIEICKKPANSVNVLFSLRDMKDKLDINSAREIVECVNKGLNSDIKFNPNCPVTYKYTNFDDYEIKSEIDLMWSLVKHRANEHNIAPQVLSCNSDLNKIAHGIKSGIPTLQGWRKTIVGDDLLDLIEGKISIMIKKGKVNVVCISQ